MLVFQPSSPPASATRKPPRSLSSELQTVSQSRTVLTCLLITRVRKVALCNLLLSDIVEEELLHFLPCYRRLHLAQSPALPLSSLPPLGLLAAGRPEPLDCKRGTEMSPSIRGPFLQVSKLPRVPWEKNDC